LYFVIVVVTDAALKCTEWALEIIVNSIVYLEINLMPAYSDNIRRATVRSWLVGDVTVHQTLFDSAVLTF